MTDERNPKDPPVDLPDGPLPAPPAETAQASEATPSEEASEAAERVGESDPAREGESAEQAEPVADPVAIDDGVDLDAGVDPDDAGPDDPVAGEPDADALVADGSTAELAPDVSPAATADGEPRRRLSSAGALIWVLLALFGFTLVVQLRTSTADDGVGSARPVDLVRHLSDLEAHDQRLQAEINGLEQSQRQLTSGVEGRQVALAETQKQADELALLAGTRPADGTGLSVVMDPKGQVKASAILNAVEELRGSGGEVMQINGADGGAVRIVASTYFVDANAGGIVVDGVRLVGPYTIWVIGSPQTMQPALQIPGGVVESVKNAGGSVTMEARAEVEVTAVRRPVRLQYARPVS